MKIRVFYPADGVVGIVVVVAAAIGVAAGDTSGPVRHGDPAGDRSSAAAVCGTAGGSQPRGVTKSGIPLARGKRRSVLWHGREVVGGRAHEQARPQSNLKGRYGGLGRCCTQRWRGRTEARQHDQRQLGLKTQNGLA